MNKLSLIYSWFVWLITFFIPNVPFLMRFRGFLYSWAMPRCGRNFQVASSVRILGLHKLEVGDNVFIAENVLINARGKITIDNEVMIGIGSLIVSSNHTKKNGSYRFGLPVSSPIFIGCGTWVAGHVVIGGGAYIPQGSLIGANSFVNKELSVAGVYVGSPVKQIKR